MKNRLVITALLCSLLVAPVAQAGLFDDAEARQQISDLQTKTNQQLDTQSKAQMELANQILGLKEEISKLRGQIETLTYENEQNKKRQQDLYLDLDSRLRKLEPSHTDNRTGETTGTSGSPPGNSPAPSGSLQEQSKAYEAALNLFKDGKHKEAVTAFENFVHQHPESDLAPNAQFWLGNAWYAQKDCKKAIDAQLVVTTRWPNASKAPDAMLAIANCQRDWGNAQASKRTLDNLIAKYPESQAATQARQRLEKK